MRRKAVQDHSSAIALGLLLCFAFAIRLYYFQQASTQPLWWDEAEYLLKAKSLVFGTPDTGFFDARPLGFPLTLAAFYELGLGETSVRVALLVASLAAVYLTYSIGERLFGTVASFAGTGLFAMFYVPIFYTNRVLTEIPRLLLGLLAARLYLSNRSVVMWSAIPVLALATFMHLTAAIFVGVFGVHFAAVHGYRQLRNNTKLVAIVVAVMFVLVVWNLDALLSTLAGWRVMFPRHLVSPNHLKRLGLSLDWFYQRLGPLLGVLLLVGAVLLLDWLRQPRKLVRGESPVLANKLFVFLWLIGTLAFFGTIVVAFQDRYMILTLPAIFWTIGLATAELAAGARRIHHLAPWAIVGAILVAGGIQFLPDGDMAFRSGVQSQSALRDAAAWIKDRTSAPDTLMSLSVPQLTYYTERATYRLPTQRDDYEIALKRHQTRFVVLTKFERHPAWIKGVSAESVGLRLVAAFPPQSPQVLVLEPLRLQ
jgi:hypothetical protein